MAKAIDNIKAWAKENVQLITILPENTTLTVDTRLKDVLETSVDEKYYLSDEKTAVLVAQLEGRSDKESIIIDTRQHIDNRVGKGARIYEDICPTLNATEYKEPKKVAEPIKLQQYSDGEGISYNIDANYAKGTSVGDIGKGRRTHVIEPKGCSTRTRSYAGQEEKLEVRKDFVSNSVTTVPKDSMVLNAEIKVIGTTAPGTGKGTNSRQWVYSVDNSLMGALGACDYKQPKQILEGAPIKEVLTVSKESMVAQLDEIMKTARPNQEIQYTFKENGDIRPHRMDAKKSGVSELNINYEGNPSHTVTSTHAPKVYGETTRWRIRKLTPLECFRLQSFPDWTFHEAAEVNSNSQLYKQAGNSVTVNVISAIAERLQ